MQQPVPALPSPVSISYGPFQPISPDEPRIPIEYIGPPPVDEFELKTPEPRQAVQRAHILSADGSIDAIKA